MPASAYEDAALSPLTSIQPLALMSSASLAQTTLGSAVFGSTSHWNTKPAITLRPSIAPSLHWSSGRRASMSTAAETVCKQSGWRSPPVDLRHSEEFDAVLCSFCEIG